MCERHSRSSVERLVAVPMLLVARGSSYAPIQRPRDQFLPLGHRHNLRRWNLAEKRVHLKGIAGVFDRLGVCARMCASICLSAGEGVLPLWTARTPRLDSYLYLRLYVF